MVEVSNCCGAKVIGSNGFIGRCSDCGEGCGVEYVREDIPEVKNKESIYRKPNKGSMYDLVKLILEQDKEARSSDRRLIWAVYQSMGHLKDGMLDYENFLICPTPETITRARRKVQELNPDLDADESTKRIRRKRELKGGYFVFNERY